VSSYSEKLRDPRWQRRRLEKLQANDFACECCGDPESTLHVHHRLYRKGADPWDYADNELAVLCEVCHAEDHQAKSELEELMCCVPHGMSSWREIGVIVAGYLCTSLPAGFMDTERLLRFKEKWALGFDVGRQAGMVFTIAREAIGRSLAGRSKETVQ
jgi:hypothetical protein